MTLIATGSHIFGGRFLAILNCYNEKVPGGVVPIRAGPMDRIGEAVSDNATKIAHAYADFL